MKEPKAETLLALLEECPYVLGDFPCLVSLFPQNVPGREYARSCPVLLTESCIRHLIKEHPERESWALAHIEDLAHTVTDPTFIEVAPSWKDKMQHWTLGLVRQLTGEDYITVVVSLANLPTVTKTESIFHQMVTVHPTKGRQIYRSDGSLKVQKWIEVKQKTGL